MTDVQDHAALKAKQRAIREGFPETMGLRAHRAISWIGRAEACGDDDDARFVFLWIAFNAAYADEREFGLVAVWCRSFDSIMCSNGDELRAQEERTNFARMRCGSF